MKQLVTVIKIKSEYSRTLCTAICDTRERLIFIRHYYLSRDTDVSTVTQLLSIILHNYNVYSVFLLDIEPSL